MEILLLVAIIVVGVSALYVAVTFNKRTRQNAAPLITDALKNVSDQFEATDSSLRQQLRIIADELQRDRELISQDRIKTRERFDHADRRISSIVGQLSAELDIIKHQGAQIGTRQERFSGDLRQLDLIVTQLGESLVRLSAQMQGIERYTKGQRAQAAATFKRIEGSVQIIGARQSKVQDKLTSIIGALDALMEINDREESYNIWAADQVLGTVKQIEAILRNQSVIESYLRTGLDYEVMRTAYHHKCRIVTASMRLEGPEADLLWPLLLSFCEKVTFKAILPESQPLSDFRWYLLWQPSGGIQLEEALSAKLAACQASPASSPQAQVGVEELCSLMIALHVGGPGTIQVGPMIINRTSRALLGCVMTAAEAMRICNADTPQSPDTYEAALRELPQGRITELTSWADSVAL